MFVRIRNSPRPYDWGSRSAMADLLGHPASGEPEAELWLGAHPGSPSEIVDPTQTGGAVTLAEWIDRDGQAALGPLAGVGRLPFLMKVLAASAPLSLQAHPSSSQAQAGFAAENAAGVPLDARHRNYRDPFHKPELIFAMTRFEALCGFRAPAETAAVVAALTDDATATNAEKASLSEFSRQLASGLPDVVRWLLSGASRSAAAVSTMTALAARLPEGQGRYPEDYATVRLLARPYPGDPGVVLALLLNRVTLQPGEVLYLPAGNIHAYLDGLGIEVMAASDNVLRGGLTSKHVDIEQLLAILDFTVCPLERLAGEDEGGARRYRVDAPDFELTHIRREGGQAEVSHRVDGPLIALCVAGSLDLTGRASAVRLNRGDSVYVTSEERALVITGTGELFVAGTGR